MQENVPPEALGGVKRAPAAQGLTRGRRHLVPVGSHFTDTELRAKRDCGFFGPLLCLPSSQSGADGCIVSFEEPFLLNAFT